jgi:uncharacterized protein YyaL (SSP411 family)
MQSHCTISASTASLLLGFMSLLGQAAESPSPTPTVESTSAKKFTNRLAQEKSPYLLQHAHNPVNWHPWGDEAFAKAKQENKAIFLSIGYSTCHWCHVMERESFENEDVAKYLNDHFISIKLDREERPDVDSIYMTAMQAMNLGGGWPLNVFLTTDRKPFYGGTYFKKEQFIKLTKQVADLWENKRAELQKDADSISAELAKTMDQSANKPGDLKKNWIDHAAQKFTTLFDAKYGGFGAAPKFPQPQIAELILLNASKQKDETKRAETIQKVLFTCQRMAAGGMYDQLGGGFSRYSVDSQWLVPHFEKMLYDNAQLINLYLNAHLVSGKAPYADVTKDILRYILRDMTHADGGFYSAEDADSEGHEGKFYCWTEAELKTALTPEEFTFAAKYFGVTAKGNFVDHSHPAPLKDQNILSIMRPDESLSADDQKLLASGKAKLLKIRSQRVRPHLDDKILVSWNGLLLGSLSRAAIILEDETYLAAARKNINFVKAKLWDANSKTLYHRYRDGARDSTQLLTAYASYLHGLLEFYQATLEPDALDFAINIADTMVAKFYDPKLGGFFSSASENDLIFRVKDDYDGAEPAGNSVAIMALLKLAAITDNAEFKTKAEKSLKLFASGLSENPEGMPLMLQAASFAMNEPHRIVLVGDPSQAETKALVRAAHQHYHPEKVILGTAGKVEDFAKTLKQREGKPTAYICTGTACQPPTTDPKQIPGLLK